MTVYKILNHEMTPRRNDCGQEGWMQNNPRRYNCSQITVMTAYNMTV